MQNERLTAPGKDRATATPPTKPTSWLSEYYLQANGPDRDARAVREERAVKLHILEQQFARADASLQRLAAVSLTLAEQDAILSVRGELNEVRNRIVRRLLDS